ncbi:hypothetical protein [Propionivibrio dicarboxylicus]|uniref:SpoIIAA-like n=1 Tax=Propionivibrio dicarboxylicus TaxID=83767 RepID=A0A1G8AE69_9RHOO|nr:hypothetical protein [Propionivibrio dicarboxylicus]SDH19228.1 hypothetical protein SAMN05660652_01359 [Propionivibrio dicarboxylicus]
MPYQSEFESNGIYTKFYGRIHAGEIEEASRRLRNHPLALGRIDYCVCDFLDVDEFVITDFEVLMLAAHDHQAIDINPELRIAIVAADARVKAIARLYAGSPLMRRNAGIFASLDEAYEWVDSAYGAHPGKTGFVDVRVA